MNAGELLTRGTAIGAAICYLLRVLLEASGGTSPRIRRWNRAIWSLGCGLLWLHIAAAFHYVHAWSHADALRHTAKQTGELIGWSWGGGVYINYALALFWFGDALCWWWRGRDDSEPSRKRYWITHAVFGFLMFNATVVFGPAYWKAIGLLFFGLLIAVRFFPQSKP